MPSLKYLSRITTPDFHRLAIYMVVYALVSHELAHVIRGHIDFLDSLPRADTSRLLEGRKLCEVDADKWGSYVLAVEVGTQAAGLSESMAGSQAAMHDIALDMLTVLGAGLYRCYSLYNQLGTQYPSLYPHPLLRAANVALGAADNFSPAKGREQVRQRLASVLTGMARAEAFAAAAADLPQKAWDIGAELVSFERKFATRLKTFGAELGPFSPARY
jgi:hypothetical protein